MIRPINDVLHVRLIPDYVRSAVVLIPDEAQPENRCDAEVLAAGPDCHFALPGDRVLFHESEWRELDEEKREGFVHERAKKEKGKERKGRRGLLAVLPASDPGEVWPLNGAVLIDPEWIPEVEQRPSGVLRSHDTLRGGEGRELHRGTELYYRYVAYIRSREFREAGQVGTAKPVGRGLVRLTYEQRRLQARFQDGWSLNDKLALREAIKAHGKTEWESMKALPRMRAPKRGRVRHAGTTGIEAGTRVYWRQDVVAHALGVGGKRLLLMPDTALDCVEV